MDRPEAPVTINMGMEMPSWFDIRSLDKNDGDEDAEGVKKASENVVKMIDEEVGIIIKTPSVRIN